ncbi:hypothetical protein FOA52_008700, partial [Chlamydomonas sp. UWO 241]
MRQPGTKKARVEALLSSLALACRQGPDAHDTPRIASLKLHLRSSVCMPVGRLLLKSLFKGMSTLGGLSSLELQMDALVPNTQMAPLASLSSLRRLTIGRVEPSALLLLSSLTGLAQLDISCSSPGRSPTGETAAALASLSCLRSLASLKLEAVEVPPLNEAEEAALCSALNALSALTRLKLQEVNLHSEGWGNLPLEMMQRLQILSLPGPLACRRAAHGAAHGAAHNAPPQALAGLLEMLPAVLLLQPLQPAVAQAAAFPPLGLLADIAAIGGGGGGGGGGGLAAALTPGTLGAMLQ